MRRQRYDLSLTYDRNGWRATFLHRSHVLYPCVGQGLQTAPGRRRGCKLSPTTLASNISGCQAPSASTTGGSSTAGSDCEKRSDAIDLPQVRILLVVSETPPSV